MYNIFTKYIIYEPYKLYFLTHERTRLQQRVNQSGQVGRSARQYCESIMTSILSRFIEIRNVNFNLSILIIAFDSVRLCTGEITHCLAATLIESLFLINCVNASYFVTQNKRRFRYLNEIKFSKIKVIVTKLSIIAKQELLFKVIAR